MVICHYDQLYPFTVTWADCIGEISLLLLSMCLANGLSYYGNALRLYLTFLNWFKTPRSLKIAVTKTRLFTKV